MRRLRVPLLSGAAAAGFLGVIVAHSLGGTTSNAVAGSGRSTTTPGTGTPSSSTPAASSPSSSAPTTTIATSKSATGQAVAYGYGSIAIRLTVRDGRIVSARVASLATNEPYSARLAAEAIPVLEREVLSAQSAHIAAVSGATYTSEGFASSAQSALDELRSS